MIIGSKRIVDKISEINTEFNDCRLNKCDNTKLLCGLIYSYLSWHPHVKYLYS